MSRARACPLLIIGTWCRALAQSASRAGIDAVVLDQFADPDTRRYARSAHRIATEDGRCIDPRLAAALAQQHAADCDALVYAAGFEQEPERLVHIAAGRTILGNSAASVRAVKHPLTLGQLLDSTGLPYPETTLSAPASAGGWLVKLIGEQGGAHVMRYTPAHRAQPGEYFQRYVAGTPCSVLFLADGDRAHVVGFSEQLTVPVGDALFCYGGALSLARLSASVRGDIEQKLDTIVHDAGLVGLNSMDFVASGERYWVLEINPRPSATMDLYDEDWPKGLLAQHIAACTGELPQSPLQEQSPRGHAVLYARRAGRVPDGFQWPVWCSDIQSPGTALPAQTPTCMVHATGGSHEQVRAQLFERRETVARALAVD